MALVFFSFNCNPDSAPKELTIFIAFLRDMVSSRISVVSSANCEILAFVHPEGEYPCRVDLGVF